MCCRSFLKGLAVFCLTFGFAVWVSKITILKECTAPPVNQLPVINSAPLQNNPSTAPAQSENKNCVPVDESLKYQTLELKDTPKAAAIKPEDKKKSEKNKKEKEFDRSVKDSVKVQDLLHHEKCFAAEKQK
jgi:hypothetical protein